MVLFQHFRILNVSRSSIVERDSKEDIVEKGGETAFERMAREDHENELKECVF